MCALGGPRVLGCGSWVRVKEISQPVVHFFGEGSWKFVEFPDKVFSEPCLCNVLGCDRPRGPFVGLNARLLGKWSCTSYHC